MQDATVVAKRYGSETEALIDQARLEALGVESWVSTDNCDGMYPQMDMLVGVRLLVRQEDSGQVRDLLSPLARTLVESPWTCPGCQEHIEAGFDTCWNCGVEWTP
jgi:hypothetical protein|nr:hypothetical protein [Candidatus Krumholzibacteria bacterium]